MVATSAAVAFYFLPRDRRHGVAVWRGLVAPITATAVLAWILVLTLGSFHTLLGVEAGSPWRWIFPAVYLVAAVGGMWWAGYLAVARPVVYERIGTGANSLVPTPSEQGWASSVPRRAA